MFSHLDEAPVTRNRYADNDSSDLALKESSQDDVDIRAELNTSLDREKSSIEVDQDEIRQKTAINPPRKNSGHLSPVQVMGVNSVKI